ncbi:MAG: ethanolamine ammonia-lyase small subunit [Planctomycetota bacterium]|jgi:ethanolamine ammonia-lyase small subunit
MSATRELVARLRRRLGEDAPLPPAVEALPLAPAPQRVFAKQLESSEYRQEASKHTPALVGVGHVGTRYATNVVLQFQAELAVAHAAVKSELPVDWFESNDLLALHSRVTNHREYLMRPDLGRRLDERSWQLLDSNARKDVDVQPILADGLSAGACEHSGMKVLSRLTRECEAVGLSVGTPMGVRFARVWLEDEIGEVVRAKVAIIILGERPGLGTGDGLSAYLVHQPRIGKTDGERNMISNIHERGLSPDLAGVRLAQMARIMLEQSSSGVNLDLSSLDGEQSDCASFGSQTRVPLVEVQQ